MTDKDTLMDSIPSKEIKMEPSEQTSEEKQDTSILTTNNSHRSAEAKARRNKRGHTKLLEKQKQFRICRSVEPPWTIKHIKEFLRKQGFEFAKLPPIRKKSLRIQFNNSADLEKTDDTLPKDVFTKEKFFQCFSS
jgi:hypothetical protein